MIGWSLIGILGAVAGFALYMITGACGWHGDTVAFFCGEAGGLIGIFVFALMSAEHT